MASKKCFKIPSTVLTRLSKSNCWNREDSEARYCLSLLTKTVLPAATTKPIPLIVNANANERLIDSYNETF